MGISRRDFLFSGTSSLLALSSGGLFAAPPGWKPDKKPALVFGVISDTHLRTTRRGNRLGANWTDRYLVSALTYFKERNVDAVVHCGDLAHRGQTRELEFHAAAWRRVFPNNRAPDGHEVVKLFVTGNHDIDGAAYGDFVSTRYPDPAERAKHVLATDIAANWERVWGEKYEGVWHKTVKGYHFFGRHWGESDAALAELINSRASSCGLDDGSKPFFFVQHRRPYASLRKAIRRRRNAFSFFGHNHWSETNWNIISRYGNALTAIQCSSCEPRGSGGGLVSDKYISKAPLEGREATGRPRQGFLVRVYDDLVVIERREFGFGGSLGPDWVMPLGKNRPHPFDRAELRKVIGTPQFRAGAALTVTATIVAEPSAAPAKDAKPAADTPVARHLPAVQIDIPKADGNAASRVYAYDIEITGEKTAAVCRKAVYAAGVNLGMGHEPNGGVTTLVVPRRALPAGGRLTVVVRPLSSLGTVGRPLTCVAKLS